MARVRTVPGRSARRRTPGLQGDYNNNGTVDAADYVVWRDNPADTFAETTPPATTLGGAQLLAEHVRCELPAARSWNWSQAERARTRHTRAVAAANHSVGTPSATRLKTSARSIVPWKCAIAVTRAL